MKATDFRNATFESLAGSLDAQRRAVYEAWLRHSPCTTRECAHRSGIDLLSLRPRTTELLQLGLLQVVSGTPASAGSSHEGRYEPTPRSAWLRWRDSQLSGQEQLL